MSPTITLTREVAGIKPLVRELVTSIPSPRGRGWPTLTAKQPDKAMAQVLAIIASLDFFTKMVDRDLEANLPIEAWNPSVNKMRDLFQKLHDTEEKLSPLPSKSVAAQILLGMLPPLREKLGDQIEAIELGRDPELRHALLSTIHAIPNQPQ